MAPATHETVGLVEVAKRGYTRYVPAWEVSLWAATSSFSVDCTGLWHAALEDVASTRSVVQAEC